MQCPIDGTELKITDRQGVEIDYCPQCRGVWLDRGELDKIIDRLYTPEAARAETPGAATFEQPGAYGEWAEPSQPSVPQTNLPPQGYPPQNYPSQNVPPQNVPPQNVPHNSQPGQPGVNQIVPAIGGLIAGLAASKMSGGHHGHYGHGRKKKKHKGWFDDMFDFDD
jgi:Zn-finger nucleic acid-binding protein